MRELLGYVVYVRKAPARFLHPSAAGAWRVKTPILLFYMLYLRMSKTKALKITFRLSAHNSSFFQNDNFEIDFSKYCVK